MQALATNIFKRYDNVHQNNFEDESSKHQENYSSECQHLNTHQGACIECGQYVQPMYTSSTYSTTHAPISQQSTTFVKEILKLDLPSEVAQKAITIYNEMKIPTHRSGKLNQVKFYCIIAAYGELEDPQDPKVIAKLCNLPENKMGAALNICRESLTGYHLTNTYTDPMDLLPKYYIELGLDPSLYHLVEDLATRILKSDKATSIRDMTPQNVAAALLQYFTEINGIKIAGSDPKDEISRIVDISAMTISNIVSKIQSIDNS